MSVFSPSRRDKGNVSFEHLPWVGNIDPLPTVQLHQHLLPAGQDESEPQLGGAVALFSNFVSGSIWA